jgi:hypothetical protein
MQNCIAHSSKAFTTGRTGVAAHTRRRGATAHTARRRRAASSPRRGQPTGPGGSVARSGRRGGEGSARRRPSSPGSQARPPPADECSLPHHRIEPPEGARMTSLPPEIRHGLRAAGRPEIHGRERRRGELQRLKRGGRAELRHHPSC